MTGSNAAKDQIMSTGSSSMKPASPAISDGRLYVRSNEYLYCIGKK